MARPSWLSKIGGEPEEEFEIDPRKFKTSMESIDTLRTEFASEREENKKSRDRMDAYLTQQQEEREARNNAEAERVRVANERKARETQESQPGFEDDVEAAFNARMEPFRKNQLLLNARQMRGEVLAADNFEYYHKDGIKTEVDRMLDQQTPEAQCRPDVIENAYKVIAFNHMKDIEEKKIKSRFAGTTNAASGTGAPSADPNIGAASLNDDEREVARKLGLTEDAYATARKEMFDNREMSHV